MIMLFVSIGTLLVFTCTKISNQPFRQNVVVICYSFSETVYRWAMHAVDLTISEYNFIHIYEYALLLQLRGNRNIISEEPY
jgi:hypothetical protein